VARALAVICPLATLYTRDAMDVALITVEVWPAGVILRLAGLPNDRTEALERNFNETLDAWARSGRKGSPPKQPAEDLFDVDLALSDDLGTSYVLGTTSRGGSGSMFRAEWSFEPGPPQSSSRLTVRVFRDDHQLEVVDLAV
jgi:hypothetical protein